MPLLGVMLPFEFEQTIRDAKACCARHARVKKTPEEKAYIKQLAQFLANRVPDGEVIEFSEGVGRVVKNNTKKKSKKKASKKK